MDWVGAWGMLVDTSLIGHLARSLCVCMRVCVRALCVFCVFWVWSCRIRYIRHFIYSLGILAYETLFPHLWNMWVQLRVPAALVSSALLLAVEWSAYVKGGENAPGS